MYAKQLIEKLSTSPLSHNEAEHCIRLLTSKECLPEQKSSVLSLINSRNISVTEVNAFVNHILSECIVPFDYSQKLMDVCGTGGDGNSTVNISTLTSLVLASLGVKICKHGNYGVTSLNGSSNILEYFGYKFKIEKNELLAELDELNITFLHAPNFHPILKNISEVRKNLQVRTIFNVLGPMVNPMQPHYRFTGVNSLQTARIYNLVYQQKNIEYKIVHTVDGNDEVTLTDFCKIYSNKGEEFMHQNQLSSVQVSLQDLKVDSLQDAAQKFLNVLQNKGSKQIKEVLLVNAAMGFQLTQSNLNFEDAKLVCKENLESGKAYETFKKLINK